MHTFGAYEFSLVDEAAGVNKLKPYKDWPELPMNTTNMTAPRPKEWDAPTFSAGNEALTIARLHKMLTEQKKLAADCLAQYEQAIRLVVATESQLKEFGE